MDVCDFCANIAMETNPQEPQLLRSGYLLSIILKITLS
jgi:hypothetical protein